jgi:serine/threonine-protein kinase HipA
VTDPRPALAKFGMAQDPFAIVKGEWVAMRLAALAGLDVPSVELVDVAGRDVLLVDRFDRTSDGAQRRQAVSALTLLGLDEMHGRWASYAELAEILRQRSSSPVADQRELFARITFNILVGNTDDHARNHAAFWDGESLRLTPAYDICPYPRAGGEATQAMIIGSDEDPFRFSQVAGCAAGAGLYGLSPAQAAEIIDGQIDVIRTNADEVFDEAGVGAIDRQRLSAVLLHPFALEGWHPQ